MRYRILALAILILGIVGAVETDAQTDPIWTGQYYNNPTLEGSPVFTRSDADIAFNWALGSPGEGIDPDEFSVRWSTDVNLQGGTYRFFVQADDYIRVTIDGSNTIIDTFDSTVVDELISRDVDLSTGVHRIQVSYQEVVEEAFAYFSFTNLAFPPNEPDFIPPNQPAPIPTPQPQATATIDVFELNVRTAPRLTATRLATVGLNETYPVLDTTNQWVQIRLNGQTGWVYRQYVTLDNSSTPGDGPTLTSTPFVVNIRSGPGLQFQDIGNFPSGATAQAVGRNADATWWQIEYQGMLGWVSAQFTTLEAGTSVGTIPVTG